MTADIARAPEGQPTAEADPGLPPSTPVATHSTQVGAAWAPMNTGSGPMYVVTAASGERRPPDPQAMARSDLDWLEQRFVPPGKYGRAKTLLQDNGVALLDGQPGSGRRSAALMLLHSLPAQNGRFHVLQADSDDGRTPGINPQLVGPGDRILLDLSMVEGRRYLSAQSELTGLRKAVDDQGAYLVVIPNPRLHELLVPESRQYLAAIERPDAKLVLSQHLHVAGFRFDDKDIDLPELADYLRHGSMDTLAQLANLTESAPDILGAEATTGDCLLEAVSAATKRPGEVTEAMRWLWDGERRALLLSVAMLGGTHSDAIFQASRELLDVLSHRENQAPALERVVLGAQLDDIGAAADPQRRVRFNKLGYGDAVLEHFWDNYPDLRQELSAWTDRALRSPVLDPQDRFKIVKRFAGQCLRTNRPGDLADLAKRWATAENPGNRMLPEAEWILRLGLRDETHGGGFRHRIYDWARETNPSELFVDILVRICVDEIARLHPGQAMVRLHHLSRRNKNTMYAPAVDGLLVLVRKESRLYRRMLERTLKHPAQNRWLVEFGLFFALATPEIITEESDTGRPLLNDASIRDGLIRGWSAAMDRSDLVPWQEHFGQWLSACLNYDHRMASRLLDILVAAARRDNARFAEIYVLARDWAHAYGEDPLARARIARELVNRIDKAQGIEPITATIGQNTKENIR